MTNEPAAVMALRREGCTLARLATAAGATVTELTAELVGRRALRNATLEALRGLLSPHIAEDIGSMAGASRAAYLAEVQAGRM